MPLVNFATLFILLTACFVPSMKKSKLQLKKLGLLAVSIASAVVSSAQTLSMVKDLNVAGLSSGPSTPMIEYNGKLYFGMNNGQYGNVLHMYTESAGAQVATGVQNTSSLGWSNVKGMVVFKGNLYLSSYVSWLGSELVKYDGSTFAIVKDLNANGQGSSNPHDMVVMGNNMYFVANNGTSGDVIWKYDGTNEPTIVAGQTATNALKLTVFNNAIYYQAKTTAAGTELWKYDGINAPKMVKDMNVGTGSFNPDYLTVLDTKLYFNGNVSTTGLELYQIDDMDSITVAADLRPGTSSSNPTN